MSSERVCPKADAKAFLLSLGIFDGNFDPAYVHTRLPLFCEPFFLRRAQQGRGVHIAAPVGGERQAAGAARGHAGSR